MSLVSFCDRVATIKVPIGTVTSPFGSIDSAHSKPHSGIDLYAPENTPVYAPLQGVVSKVHDYGSTGLGKSVFVRLSDGRQYIMGHLNEVKVRVGDKVNKGDLLALSGNTGRSTGGHLHFAAVDAHGHFIDPELLFKTIESNFHLWVQNIVAQGWSETAAAYASVMLNETSNSIIQMLTVSTVLV